LATSKGVSSDAVMMLPTDALRTFCTTSDAVECDVCVAAAVASPAPLATIVAVGAA
jgi:hypothetical protein